MFKNKEHKVENYYHTNFEHIADELEKLDLIIKSRIIEFNAENEVLKARASANYICITPGQIEHLLAGGAPVINRQSKCAIQTEIEKTEGRIKQKLQGALQHNIKLALPQLSQAFGLSNVEMQAIIICLAPELRRKYDTLYAYLQDDITRKKPSADLILDLLFRTEHEKWKARVLFDDQGPLLRAEILRPVLDTHNPSGSSGLARFLTLDQGILRFILGKNGIHADINGIAELIGTEDADKSFYLDHECVRRIYTLAHFYMNNKSWNRKLMINLHGAADQEKLEIARHVSGKLGRSIISIDCTRLFDASGNADRLLMLAFRETLLHGAVLFCHGIDDLQESHGNKQQIVKKICEHLKRFDAIAFICSGSRLPLQSIDPSIIFHADEVRFPGMDLSEKIWDSAIGKCSPEEKREISVTLARSFRLSSAAVERAVQMAENEGIITRGKKPVSLDGLMRACRSVSTINLSNNSLRIDPVYTMADIVLPDEKKEMLRELCSQARMQDIVMNQWGFGEKITYGKGLNVLFAGEPGTGKTMAAQVIASELNLDLYKIDLATIVSKYIGETEKNISDVFRQAEAGNAILFFDEADALFGKRTAVTDAHDRYANIEVCHLLQKMEEYCGIAILATNRKENLDEAFIRRFRMIVEFPFPDHGSRQKIWQAHFPDKAPYKKDKIDFPLLAKKFSLSGGNIKNAVVHAAFLAAQDGGFITMEHLLKGTKREYEKTGRIWSESYGVKS